MPEVEEEFEHRPTVFTAGDLKRAMADVPDNAPMVFWVADEPGGDLVDEQIAYDAGMHEGQFGVSLEFRPGTYLRKVWRDD